MKQKVPKHQAIRFRRFAHKSYAAFRSIGKVVTIGVVAATTLTYAVPQTAQAQNAVSPFRTDGNILLEEIEVTSSPNTALPLLQSKPIAVITSKEIAAAPVSSIEDLLKRYTAIEVRQRGAGGIQSDISMRGGSFDQVVILLDGINLNNPQTGHYNFDLPVNLSDIDRIELLSSTSAHLYGINSFAGVINIITKEKSPHLVTAQLSAGKYNLIRSEADMGYSKGVFAQRLSAGYSSSTGYTDNTAFQRTIINSHTTLNFKPIKLALQLGYNGKGFGANSFYSPAYPNQYEATNRFYGALTAKTNHKIPLSLSLSYSNHNDRFELFHNNPASWYKDHNYHRTQVGSGALSTAFAWIAGETNTGIHLRYEEVISSVLGTPLAKPIPVTGRNGSQYSKWDNRLQLSYFLTHSYQYKGLQLTGSINLWYSSTPTAQFYPLPAASVRYRWNNGIECFASWNMAVRVPTFTDLYYESKTNIGNPNLRNERSQNSELGIRFNHPAVRAEMTLFHRQGKDLIDWVKEKPEDKWESRNLTAINTSGIEIGTTFYPQSIWGQGCPITHIGIGYSYLYQEKESYNLISNYLLDYLRHKATATLEHKIYGPLSASWSVRYDDRMGSYVKYEANKPTTTVPYTPYALLDLKIKYQTPKGEIFAEATNLFNTSYCDLGNINQPGRWIVAGIKVIL